MITGAVTATAGIFAGLITDAPATTTGDALLAQPAAVSVPLAFLTMWLVSVCDPHRPRDVAAHMLALHGPEQLGLAVAQPPLGTSVSRTSKDQTSDAVPTGPD
jgi:hypothetical protein